MNFVCALPVKESQRVGKYQTLTFPGGKAVKHIHLGNYNTINKTYKELDDYLKFKNLQLNGPPIEIYVTDPSAEMTEIFYPIR